MYLYRRNLDSGDSTEMERRVKMAVDFNSIVCLLVALKQLLEEYHSDP
jgi:hypothetical protein